jgi:hypothetical protein
MAFKSNIRNFGKRQGKVATKFVRGVDTISKRRVNKSE